jgi:hypothetical protein
MSRPAPVTITVNGKDFIVYGPSVSHTGNVYHTYFSTRDGKEFGPIRTASASGGPKTVGRQLTVAAREHFASEAYVMAYVTKIAYLRRNIAEVDPTGRWADEQLSNLTGQLARIEAAVAADPELSKAVLRTQIRSARVANFVLANQA